MRTRPITLIAALLACICFAGCGKSGPDPASFRYQQDPELFDTLAQPADYPATRFIVLTDPHYYHPGLGTSGPDFARYIREDRKMLALSDEILEAAASEIQKQPADFILICGDMTKDGERINHLHVAEKIRRLHPTADIYVVPGNHDVRNPEAVRYTHEGSKGVETVEPEGFSEIYGAYGYDAAIARDPESLSYVAEPVDGLWLFALDSCLWRKNRAGGHPVVNGRFSDKTLKWLEDMLIQARKNNKAAIAMMHHGLVAHYPGNEKYYGEYVVDHSEAIARLLAAYGVRLVFTGHFHAQDITVKQFEDLPNPVFDIETGSLVTWPCPWREITISAGQTCTIESRFIKAIDSMPEGFSDYAHNFALEGTVGLARDALEQYHVSEKGMDLLAPQIAEAYLAHLAGDEDKPDTVISAKGTGIMGRVVVFFQKDLVEGWWTDLPPADNRLVIDLESNSWQQPDDF